MNSLDNKEFQRSPPTAILLQNAFNFNSTQQVLIHLFISSTDIREFIMNKALCPGLSVILSSIIMVTLVVL